MLQSLGEVEKLNLQYVRRRIEQRKKLHSPHAGTLMAGIFRATL